MQSLEVKQTLLKRKLEISRQSYRSEVDHSGMHKAVCALFYNVIKTFIERFTVASFVPSFNQAEASEGREGDDGQRGRKEDWQCAPSISLTGHDYSCNL